LLRNKAGKLDDCTASRTVVPGYTFPVRDLARINGTLRLLLSVCFIRGRVRAMHIKNTIPAEFVFNSALMKNIENTLIKQHRTVNNERMITEIQHRLQTESNEILSDLYLQALDMLYSKPHH
jgi:hypothetical protein